jgi:hypothetical protein
MLLTIILLVATQVIFAWGANGHRIVAQICYDNLSADVQIRINKLLGDDYLTQVATWPDYIRSEPKWNFTQYWHYITINPDQTVEQVMEQAAKNDSIDNVIEAIQFMALVLNEDHVEERYHFKKLMEKHGVTPLNGSIDATALAFLVHFIGDIHQPMHVGKGTDRGGNLVDVQFFSEKMNLHSVWDEGIIEKEQLSFTEFAAFVNKHHIKMKEQCENDDIVKWTTESVIARENIYNTLKVKMDTVTGLPDLKYVYQHDNQPVIEKRLAAAGYRAAAMLNKIYNKS